MDGSGVLTPNRDIAEAFVAALTGESHAVMRLRFIHDRDRSQPSAEREGTLAQLWPDILEHQPQGYGVFFFLNAVRPGAGSGYAGMARDEDVESIRVLGADFDNGLPDEWEFHAAPHLFVQTSIKDGVQRGQVLWRVSDCAVADFKVLQQRLAARYGTDPQVCNLSRVFRLPGTLHQKRQASLVTFSAAASKRPLPVLLLMKGIPALPADHKPRAEGDAADSPQAGTDRAVTRSHLRDILRHIDPGGDRAPWRDIIAAIRATPVVDDAAHEDALGIAKEWSSRWADWNAEAEAELEKIWRTMPPKIGGAGYGTIYHRACEAGYTGRPAQEPASVAFADHIARSVAEYSATDGEPVDPHGSTDASDDYRRMVDFFRGREPDEDENLPPIEFWDAEKTLPKMADGATVIYYGPFGQHKTTVAMADALDAIDKGARVVFAAGEGAQGVRKNRLPAACRKRGLSTKDLRGKWRTCPAVPVLTNDESVSAFIEAFKDFKPDIVFIDTLATAAGAAKENEDAFGKLLVSTGPVGRIRRAFGCLVVLLHHSGKDLARGARGHSSQGGNVDGLHQITADKELRTVSKFIEKMRDAEDGFFVEYAIGSATEIPVASKIGRANSPPLSKAKIAANDLVSLCEQALAGLRIRGDAAAISGAKLAYAILRAQDPRAPENSAEATPDQARAWDTLTQRLRRATGEKDFAHLAFRLSKHKTAAWQWRLVSSEAAP